MAQSLAKCAKTKAVFRFSFGFLRQRTSFVRKGRIAATKASLYNVLEMKKKKPLFYSGALPRLQKLLCLGAAAVFALYTALPAFATSRPASAAAASKTPSAAPSTASSADSAASGAAQAPPATISDSYIVMDAATGQILIQKNGTKQRAPASITKILTLAMALEKGDPYDTVVTVPKAAVATKYDFSHISLVEGEQIPLYDALMATVLMSANDAATTLAVYTSGDLETWKTAAAQRIAALGLTDTVFLNPTGMPQKGHISTAKDMAEITRWALTVPRFKEIFGAAEFVMQPTNKQKNTRKLGTSHMLLVESKYFYPGTLGGKLGWSEESGHTMVSLNEKNGMTLIIVTMGSAGKYDKFKDATALLNYCFDNFKLYTFAASALPAGEMDSPTGKVTLKAEKDFTFLLHRSVDPASIEATYQAPTASGGAFRPAVRFSLGQSSGAMEKELGTFPMGYVITAAVSDAAVSSPPASYVVPPAPTPADGSVVLLVQIAAGVLLLLSTGYFVLSRPKRPKKVAARLSPARTARHIERGSYAPDSTHQYRHKR